jgi:hypothetical protein
MIMENKELMSEWKKNSIRIGTPTNLLAAFTSFIPVIWLCITYNCWPDPKVVLAGWGMVALSFGAFYVVEPISYYAALGLTGTYLSFLSGNIGNMRVPCATMALETTESEPGTLQAEVASTMAICGSIITNLIETLQSIINCGWNLKLASEKLFLHYNSVKYRFQKICDLLEIDLRDNSRHTEIELALKIYLIQKNQI